MKQRAPLGSLAAAATTVLFLFAVGFDLSPLLRGPAPYPPEWQWGLRAAAPQHGYAATIAWALGLTALIAAATPALIAGAKRRVLIALLLLACCGSVGFTVSLTGMVQGESAAEVLTQRTMSAGFTSYHHVAVGKHARDPRAFLENFAELAPNLPVHAQAHPPGPVMFYRGVLGVVEAAPALGGAFAEIAREGGFESRRKPEPSDAKIASALLGSLLLILIASLSPLVSAAFARALGASRLASFQIGLLMAAVPGMALMTPTFDKALIPPILLSSLFIARATAPGVQSFERYGSCLATGLLAGICFFCSFGSPIFLAIGAALAIAANLTRGATLKRDVLLPSLAIGAASVVFFFAPMLVGYDPIAGLRAGLEAHSESFTNQRSYWTWLFFNLSDFAIFVGVPLAVLFGIRIASSARDLIRIRTWSKLSVGSTIALTFAGALFLLDLSGIVRGEVGRLWTPLIPFAVIATCYREVDKPIAAGAAALGPALLLSALALCSFTIRCYWQLP